MLHHHVKLFAVLYFFIFVCQRKSYKINIKISSLCPISYCKGRAFWEVCFNFSVLGMLFCGLIVFAHYELFSVGMSRYECNLPVVLNMSLEPILPTHMTVQISRKHQRLLVKRHRFCIYCMPFAQDPCSHYVCIYLKSMHELQRLRTTTDETFMTTYFVKFFIFGNYTLLFSALNPVRWNVANNANYHN